MYDDDYAGESPLAKRHRRRKKIFGWVALLGISTSVLGGVISQLLG